MIFINLYSYKQGKYNILLFDKPFTNLALNKVVDSVNVPANSEKMSLLSYFIIYQYVFITVMYSGFTPNCPQKRKHGGFQKVP